MTDNITAIYAGRLNLSRITYRCDLERSGLVIPLGVMAEFVLSGRDGRTRVLGLIARTALDPNETDTLARMVREQLQSPFDYLKKEFDWAWLNAPAGQALGTLASRHQESLLFAAPVSREIKKPAESRKALQDPAKRDLCEARDQEFKLMIAELSADAPAGIEEHAKLAA